MRISFFFRKNTLYKRQKERKINNNIIGNTVVENCLYIERDV